MLKISQKSTMKNIRAFCLKHGYRMVVRPHPTEVVAVYLSPMPRVVR